VVILLGVMPPPRTFSVRQSVTGELRHLIV
jgi:hypothetical protein